MKARLLVLGLGAGMLASLLGGLARLGVVPPVLPAPFVAHHGVLMGAVLFPGLIGLERAVAVGRPWAWSAPLMALIAAIGLLTLGPPGYPLIMMLALLLGIQHLFLWSRSPGLDSALPVVAAVLLLLTDWRWGQGAPAGLCALGWASFLILVIAAERLEFSFLRGKASLSLTPTLLLLVAGLLAQQSRLLGLAWLLLSLWLARNDIARRNARRSGMAAYTARSVLLGYFWMALSGLQLTLFGLPHYSGPQFDRILHGVFVGFVLSMVVAHGPLIFPAICKTPIRFSPWFYLPLALLHLSLALRCWGWASIGASGNLLAMVCFALTMATHHTPGHNPWLQATTTTQPKEE